MFLTKKKRREIEDRVLMSIAVRVELYDPNRGGYTTLMDVPLYHLLNLITLRKEGVAFQHAIEGNLKFSLNRTDNI